MFRCLNQICVVIAIVGCLLCGCSRVDPELAAREAAKAMADGEFRKGVELARKAAEAVPDNPEYGVLYGFALFETDEQREAKDQFERTVAASPDSFLAHYFHGWVLWRSGEYGDAIPPLRNALRLKKGYEEQVPDAMVLLARCCLKQNLPEGSRYLQGLRAYRGFAQEPEVYNCLGMLNVGQGEHEQALRKFQQALELDPNNPVILQNIAVLYDTYFRDPKQAMVYYRESLVRRIERKDTTNQAAIRDRLRQLARERRARD